MLFRLWFQVLNKLALVATTALFVSIVFGRFEWSETLKLIALAVLFPIAAMSATLAVLVFIVGWRMKCPLCGRPSEPAQVSQYDMGVDCEHCGVVHLNLLTQFRLRVDPPKPAEDERRRS